MIHLTSIEKTRELATAIAQNLNGNLGIELIGDVGAGKTTFTSQLAKALGITDPIQSPTFTISHRYEAKRNLTLAHYDFYRLHDAGILRDELDETINDSHTVTVVEWAEIVNDVLPDDRLQLHFKVTGETSRQVTISSGGPKSGRILELLRL